MKYYIIFTLSLLFYFGAAIPIPSKDNQPLDKGKGRAITPPPNPSRPNTPTQGPEHDHKVPLPGRSGTHTDANRNVVTLYYGDDDLPEHMGHLQRNQESFPHNRDPMPLRPTGDVSNRDQALQNVNSAPLHPVTGLKRVKDEKLPNMMDNPHHATSTTVEYLPKEESHIEGGYTGGLRRAAKKLEKTGHNVLVQVRINPGWLTLHPDQRRGSEAPARLNLQILLPSHTTSLVPAPTVSGGWQAAIVKTKDPKAKKSAAVPSKNAVAGPSQQRPAPGEGYTPVVGLEGNKMTLRHRPGVDPPPKIPVRVKKPKDGPSSLTPGFVSDPGHVWKPSTTLQSHAGAPGHLPNAEQRFPPRPQNHEHYMKQLAEKKAADDKQAHVVLKAPPHLADAYAKFEAKFGPARVGNGAGRSHEAPGRIRTTAPPAPPHAAPHAAPHPPAAPPAAPHTGPHAPQTAPHAPHIAPHAPHTAPAPHAAPHAAPHTAAHAAAQRNHHPTPHHVSPPSRPHPPNHPQSKPPSPHYASSSKPIGRQPVHKGK